MAGWGTPIELLKVELCQRRDEGVQIPRALLAEVAALHPIHDAWNEARVWPIYDALMALPEDAALAADEPNELAEIRALRPDGPRDLKWIPTDDVLLCSGWESCMAKVEEHCTMLSPTQAWDGEVFPGMNPVHTINNALICVLALFYGKMDTVDAPAPSP